VNRSRLAFALALLAPTVVLGGCSDDPVPKVAPPSDSPSVVSETPSPSGSAKDPVGAVRAWVRAQNVALHTGDTAEMRGLSATPCESCDGFAEPIEQVYRNGGSFKTRGWTVNGAKARAGTSQPVVIDTAVTIAGGRTVRAAGQDPVVYAPEKHIMVFKVLRNEGSYAVSFIGFIS